MTPRNARVALNPLPWMLDSGGFRPLPPEVVPAVFGEIRAAGFSAVMAEVPSGMSATAYTELLAAADLSPAPGYFAADFEDDRSAAAVLAAARRVARQHRELGLSEIFVAGGMVPARLAQPAVGADFDRARLAAFVRNLAVVAAAMLDEDVRACLHPHVGSLIETEREVRGTLDRTDPDVLAFGPDTGHLSWAGMTPGHIIGDYADRVAAVHLKDVHHAIADEARSMGRGYDEATRLCHLWAEPGRGDVDLQAVLDVLADRFAGWWIVEVDVPTAGLTPAQSSAVSAEWVAQHFDDVSTTRPTSLTSPSTAPLLRPPPPGADGRQSPNEGEGMC